MSIKCTPCDTVTTQEVLKILPDMDTSAVPTEELKDKISNHLDTQRRLIICTNCGTISLKK